MVKLKASVVINTKDRFTRLHITLKALEGQVGESVEVIVVFDGCVKETLEAFYNIKLAYPVKSIVLQDNQGRAIARNIGAKAALGEIIIFIDDDRVPGPDFIDKHIEAHRKNCIVLGNRKEILISEAEIGKISASNQTMKKFLENLESKAGRALDSHETILRRALFFRHNPLLWLLFYTGNISIVRDDLVTVGFFDENFKGWGYEDLEIGYRFHKRGIAFIKDNRIINYHLAHEIAINDMHREALRNLDYFSRKAKGDLPAIVVIGLIKLTMYVRLWRRYLIRAKTVGKTVKT